MEGADRTEEEMTTSEGIVISPEEEKENGIEEEEKNGIEEEPFMRAAARSGPRRRSRLNSLIEVRRESMKTFEQFTEEELMSPIEDDVSEQQELEPGQVKMTEAKLRRISQRVSVYHANIGKERLVEVRLLNVSYHVPVRADTPSVPTIWNATPLYKAYRFFRRIHRYRMWREAEESGQNVAWVPKSTGDIFQPYRKKTILNNINLVLKPGNSYLILGPPGCGELLLSNNYLILACVCVCFLSSPFFTNRPFFQFQVKQVSSRPLRVLFLEVRRTH